MSQKIAVGEAIGAGFRLIGREPLAFAVWCGVYFLSGAVPMAFTWGETQAVYSALAAGDADAASRQAWGPVEIISIVVSLVLAIALPAAVARAVLYPNDRQYLYLRLGRRELWFMLTMIILIIMGLMAYFACILLFALLAAVGGAVSGGDIVVAGILGVLSFVAVVAGACWLAVKFSMSGMMSFADRKLRIFESWALTRGNGWRIFLVGLALFALTLMVSLVAFLGFAISAAGSIFEDGSDGSAMLTALANTSAPMAMAVFLIFSVVWVAISVVGAAAWADVHRQLRPAFAETFD